MQYRYLILSIAVASLVATVNGCDPNTSNRLGDAEKAIQQQAERTEALQTRINELDSKVLQLDFSKDQYKSVTLDPSDQGFERLDSSVGTFAISIQQVSAHADGVRVRLHVGNLTTATVNGGTFKARWGSRMPKVGGEGLGKAIRFLAENASRKRHILHGGTAAGNLE